MIVYGMYITTKVSDHLYNLEVQGQCQIHLNSVFTEDECEQVVNRYQLLYMYM